jgi:hypothetical protein
MALPYESSQIDKLKSALDWYAEQAMKLNVYVLELDKTAMLEVMASLARDNGTRAREAALNCVSNLVRKS